MELKNDLFLRAARGEAIERYPVWLMRQAGRILPEYRALRATLSGFKELVETPALAAEVTIQPVDHLDVDAAIIFSDILVVPEAMGLPYQMLEQKGPWFEKTIRSKQQLDLLDKNIDVADRLSYVFEALKITKRELNGRVPLIDSWAGILGKEQYATFGLHYINKIVDEFPNIPFTVFSKGAVASLPEITKVNCTTIGLDWNMDMGMVRDLVGETKTLQGNLDPCLLYASNEIIEKETLILLKSDIGLFLPRFWFNCLEYSLSTK